MNKRYSMLIAVAVAVTACADTAPSQDPAPNQEQAVGNLTLNLVGADSDGREYRLRNAVFNISGQPEFPFPGFPFPYPDSGAGSSQTVSTETNPDAPVISLRVIPGNYYVNLQSTDWYLERLTGGNWERVEQAVLLSS